MYIEHLLRIAFIIILAPIPIVEHFCLNQSDFLVKFRIDSLYKKDSANTHLGNTMERLVLPYSYKNIPTKHQYIATLVDKVDSCINLGQQC